MTKKIALFWPGDARHGVTGNDNTLLLASNLSDRWSGLLGLLNTGACLESLNRPFSRVWTSSPDVSQDPLFMARLAEWCETGKIKYGESQIACSAPVRADAVLQGRGA